jgi:bisphosphoglycerate-independent phosphoglycerate mutase (AlkP superfamily)
VKLLSRLGGLWRGDDVRLMTPARAGEALARIALAHDFTLYEYFLTDFAGHRRNMSRAVRYLQDIDGALGAVLNYYDLGRHLLLLTSDHGNVEDLSTRSHTVNPVPLLVAGPGHGDFAARADDIMDVAPRVFAYLGVDPVKYSGRPIREELIKLPE